MLSLLIPWYPFQIQEELILIYTEFKTISYLKKNGEYAENYSHLME